MEKKSFSWWAFITLLLHTLEFKQKKSIYKTNFSRNTQVIVIVFSFLNNTHYCSLPDFQSVPAFMKIKKKTKKKYKETALQYVAALVSRRFTHQQSKMEHIKCNIVWSLPEMHMQVHRIIIIICRI